MSEPPPNPKSAIECLTHCRNVLTVGQFDLAVALIELYAQLRCNAATEDVFAAIKSSFAAGDPKERLQ